MSASGREYPVSVALQSGRCQKWCCGERQLTGLPANSHSRPEAVVRANCGEHRERAQQCFSIRALSGKVRIERAAKIGSAPTNEAYERGYNHEHH
jgi:hypothetical protein